MAAGFPRPTEDLVAMIRQLSRGIAHTRVVRLAVANVALAAVIVYFNLAAPLADAAPCDPPVANPILCENSKPGNPQSEWDVAGAGSPSIQGFATEFSVNKGHPVSFKVDTDASDYRIDVYRLGYYGGAGARKIATVQPSVSLPQNQPDCLSDAATGLVDCGNWAVSATWNVPSTAVSGIYIGKLVRESGGAGASHIPFIVRDDDAQSDVLFQTSDTTWQAYNTYGGNSLYTGNPVGRAYKVSYNRPFTTRQGMCCVGSIQSYLFSAEYPMVRWLERNAYDVSYFSGIDTDRRGGELLEHQVFLSVGHDEYWSGQQRANVEAARNAGVNLAFFSGNEVFWKTRWESSIDGSNTPYRTLVVYKETKAGAKIDPSPEWTGTWRDPRFSPPSDGGRPENALTGTIFMVNGPSRNDAIEIPAEAGKLRFWRNTSIANLPDGGVATLPTGVLGFEWDEDADNGHRPPGLVLLSETALPVSTYLLDYGNTFGGGVATHRLTMYRHASGALVFGAGTVQWSWGLDPTHDVAPCCPAPTSADSRMQQATVNILADMGVQPGSLQSNLVAATASSDTAPPSSTVTSPSAGASIGGAIQITGTAIDSGGGRVGGVEVSFDDGATWHPADGRENWSYTWQPAMIGSTVIRSRAVDDSGNIGPASAGVPVTTTAAVASFNDLTAGRPLDGLYPAGQIDWGTGQWIISPPYGQFDSNSISFSDAGVTSATLNFVVPRRLVSVDASSTGSASTVSIACEGQPTKTQTVGAGSLATINTGWSGGCTTVTVTSSNGWDTNFDNFVFDDAGIEPDTTPPLISSVQASVSGTKANITWTTDENADTQVEYGTTTAYGSSTTLNESFVTSHSATISGLTLGTTYHYRVKSRDPSGNVSVSGDFTFTADCPCTLWDASAQPAVASAPDTAALEVGVKFQSDAAGYITGLRFYKGTGNTGTHVGHLWTGTGQLLAQATFTNETATGWQQVNFAAPVAIQANTTYVASYHAPNGGFSYTRPYFNGEYSAPPLRALSDGASGGNGLFKWGPPGFPTSTFQASNYWVDVVFTSVASDTVPPTVEVHTPGVDATGVSPNVTLSATFNEAVTPASVSFVLRDEGGNIVPASVSVNGSDATLDPNALLGFEATYTATVSGAADSAGNVMVAPKVWSFTTGAAATSIWNASATPAIASQSDSSPVELGLKFRTDVDGYIQGVRFYKGPSNTGTHVGNLWTATGQLLARATFTNETATGWQEVLFSAPVQVSANTTYVVSYHAPNGGYALNQNFFSADVVNFPLRALAAGVDGPNGLFRYGPTAFPDQSYASSNYWVDVVFGTSVEDNIPPGIVDRAPAPNSANVAPATNITATFDEPVDATTLSFSLRDADNANVPAAVSYDSGSRSAVLNPNADLALGETYTATVSVSDVAGNQMGGVSWSFSTPACPCTIWDESATPVLQSQSDLASVELGMKFRSDIDGYITGMRFFKGPFNTGTHRGNLWTANGELLATAIFSSETDLGWQQVTFDAPVAVTANTTYVVSYFAPNGGYSLDVGYFNSERVSWPLRALDTSVAGGNGLYRYGAASAFPTNTYNGSNYWVDVVFSPTADDEIAPTLASRSPAGGANDVATDANVTATFSEAVDPSTLSFTLEDAGNNAVGALVSYDSASRTATLNPNSRLSLGGTFTATVSASDPAGNAMAPVSWSFSTEGCPCSFWDDAATPDILSEGDTAAITLGVRFRSEVAGQVIGLRFYKGPANTGTHIGHLWTAGGVQLASATFTGETASGWQQVLFATPVAISANTTYVASYHAPNGGYSRTVAYFANPFFRYPLEALAGTNGVYAYGPAGTFPSSTWGFTNYWVDVIFRPGP